MKNKTIEVEFTCSEESLEPCSVYICTGKLSYSNKKFYFLPIHSSCGKRCKESFEVSKDWVKEVLKDEGLNLSVFKKMKIFRIIINIFIDFINFFMYSAHLQAYAHHKNYDRYDFSKDLKHI